MSESESFIEEVTEELRRDRLFGLMRRYGWIVLLAVVAIVAGAAWFEWQKAQARAAAEARGDAVLEALTAEDGEGRMAALKAVPAEGDFAAVMALLEASEAQASDDPEGAAETLMGVAENQSLPRPWRDLAGLKAAMLGGEALEPARRDALLERLAEPGAPFAALAGEQQVYVLLEKGETEAALSAAKALLEGADASQGLQERLSQVIVALGGTPGEG